MTAESKATYVVQWSDVPEGGLEKNLCASPQECRKLAEVTGVVSLSNVQADFKITRWQRRGLKVAAVVRAEVVQNCVVSLDTVSSCLAEPAEWCFKPEAAGQANVEKDAVLLIDPMGEDPADLLIDGRVDLERLLAEQLCLMIDPFKRSTTAEFDDLYKDVQESSPPPVPDTSPFAILKQIGKNQRN